MSEQGKQIPSNGLGPEDDDWPSLDEVHALRHEDTDAAYRKGWQAAIAVAENVCRKRVNQNDAKMGQHIAGSPEFYAFGNRSDEAEELADAIAALGGQASNV
jgi:hypothetical protein